jgi:hypothetical protein
MGTHTASKMQLLVAMDVHIIFSIDLSLHLPLYILDGALVVDRCWWCLGRRSVMVAP